MMCPVEMREIRRMTHLRRRNGFVIVVFVVDVVVAMVIVIVVIGWCWVYRWRSVPFKEKEGKVRWDKFNLTYHRLCI